MADEIGVIRDRLKRGYTEGRYPLFILGAGVSARRVPLLADLGKWFCYRLRGKNIPNNLTWARACAMSLAEGNASRRDAADFFSLMQSDIQPFAGAWTDFSRSFLCSGFRVAGSKLPHPIFSPSLL